MTCERYREAASARMDGEPLQLPASALDHHLATCSQCAAWLAEAERLGRALRISGQTAPDLSAAILNDVVLPARRLGRYRRRLRLGLIALGFVQWALAVPALFGNSVGMSMGVHTSHESAAWNLALGASFLAVAVKPSRASGTLPILATFVVVLSALSISDVATHAVDPARLASHIGVVLGLLLVGLVARSEWSRPRSRAAAPGSVPAVEDELFRRRHRGAA
ncbi:zf-HC2 domain-containing protein [Jatrophihabitans telluris]|uniref:Zf-HC2 domain-containing protein n=1 Tax=Jatrophihabitans telluris TaxID=2038343 RepID=A0ABY4QWF8_9ACTN|nr:zf-HC2 domain-containing protein [Jatrophihabitans telluris]UQX87659.1 zf-HC2 domain-containing protein [Jatrophihabitans telluris]